MPLDTDVSARIHRLPANVVNQIAAGEVIERPASVVKELLENSVDALATRIDVEVEQGGADLIRIVDDGEGIHPDDMELAVTSHATSKLTSAEELFRVATLGFRGEAMASIAEVSQLSIRSKQRDQPGGTQLEVHGGQIRNLRLCGCPDGTQVEVRQLFFNTPVRRKFLKTAATEFAHIVEQFTRVALAHPRLQMTLRHSDRLVHELPPSQQLLERLELFFGSSLAAQLIPVEAEQPGARIWGYVAHPSQSKATRKGQYLFLNGRWIQDRSLQHALGEAYRGLVMVGRYPIAFLFLELDPELVDVNVHPCKSEVRFQDSQSLYRLLLSTLRSRFLSMELDSRLSVPARADGAATAGDRQRELVAWKPSQREPVTDFRPFHATEPDSQPRRENTQNEAAGSPPSAAPGMPAGPLVHAATAEAVERPASAAAAVRAMQVHDCYLVVETTEGITVIDQHALHERIMYEQLRTRVLSGKLEIQKLLIPITVELSGREAGLLLAERETLAELGLQVQEFGGNTVALAGYPTLLSRADPQTLLQDVVALLEDRSRKLERRDLLDSLLHMMSCKAAIKAGQRLSLEEIESLLEQRHLCDDAHHCPHGRPTALKLTRDELDRQFGRLG